ncbi:autotransporter outer membrane beta-barrel domain-containing protein [Rhodanobacter sp. FW510-R12]|uniref:autotransporter outer membrane beta-barrel domain-containing protein n=1 Tax=unclassified Rhodanobacter TaxID=2621553 RepID=UPI0007AA09F7|nr:MULTISPECIES: autotransporter domain-containing protein [unclassified Rhodanobacter]KZC16924.1 autotransporter outer membrane beta-barrel domain-containing protein [Rhodanobacter sp. FW104-R8]KZC27273.1 autotransporter outer membrane beta-barrel domain-containing protein [Rhodanobacter sp. FW510-T8]KZC31710.1 autotransporter outer membrane beta-barrel domain-containing protein [Rhodanobacter sp. FW510-R10]
MLRTRHLAGAIATALLFSTAAAAADFSNVIVFGDSLSDGGNISLASAPGIQPPLRFTTNPGLTAAENVAAGLGFTLKPSVAGGTDFAWGGAGFVNNVAAVPTIPQQLQMYLGASGGKADSRALYQVWGGANDIFYLSGALTDPNAIAVGAVKAAQTELGLLNGLQAAGAKYVVVYNLPNLGLTPSAAAGGPAAQAGATQLAVLYNGVLSSGLGQLSGNGLNVIPVNTYALLNEVVANPSAYGLSNVTAPACGAGSSSVQCGPQGSGLPYTYAPGTNQTYLFADGVHPTAAVHAMLGQYVLATIHAPEQISMLGEAPLSSTAVQGRVVRKQMLMDSTGGETRAFVNIDYGMQRFDASNSSPKTRSDNFNLTLGADARASDNLSAGLALGIGRNNADFSGGRGGYTMQDISALGYLTYHVGGGYIGGYADFGQSNFKNINRHIDVGTARRTESGKTDGTHLGGGLTGGWWFDVSSLRTGPFATVEWQTVKVSGYNESGNDSSAMWFGRQQRDALIATLGWRLQGDWNVGNTVLSPFAELAWNHDDKAGPRMVSAGLNSMNGTFALPGFTPDRNWGSVDLGLSAKLTPSVTSWIGYNGRFSDNSQKYNSFNMGFKVMF